MVRLAEIEREAELAGAPSAGFLDIGQAVAAIDRRLAHAEHVQIRPVEDENQPGFSPRKHASSGVYIMAGASRNAGCGR